MPPAAVRPHVDAVVTALTAAGVAVDRGQPPTGAGWQGEPGASVFKPYAVLYPATGALDGDLADPNEYLDWAFQVTCVGATQDAAVAVTDKVTAALVGRPLAVEGRFSYLVYLTLSRPAERDDDVAPPVHYTVTQFTVRTAPA